MRITYQYRCFNFLILLGVVTSELPVIIWHGMGDHGHNAGILEMAETIRKMKPGIKVKSISTGKTIAEDIQDSYFKPCNEQVEQICTELLADPDFANGMHMIGLSQGGLLVRALAQRCPFPKLGAIISIGGPQMGVYGVPKCRDLPMVHICHIMEWLMSRGAYTDFVQEHLVQAQYWHDPMDEKEFREKCHFLSDINQENRINTTYLKRLSSVQDFVLVRFLQDTIVKPKESEWFGYYDAMSTEKLHTLQESALYKEDRLGLKTLADTKRLHFLEFDSDHLQFSLEWFKNEIVRRFIVKN